ncbi:DUF7172 family protein [Nocardia miyunensis]|uniref:DUF7172 family protein n=1 Tax=Nocardia miyunensis TaxID=282684 RepID=UPI0008367E93|nr:hypothetical protein [Nocardia miyunensis]
MAPQVCTDRNLRITSGTLGLEKWSAPRMVLQASVASTADGAITGAGFTTIPGKLLIDASMSWTSDSPLPLMMRLQVIRSYRTIICSNPNAIQIWDSWTTGIDQAARTPDTYSVVNSLTTLGVDIGTDNTSQPYYGRIHQDYPACSTEEWWELPAGSVLNIKYRAYVWTPPPWSNNASANTPLHEAWARGVKLRLWAFPTGDTEVQ